MRKQRVTVYFRDRLRNTTSRCEPTDGRILLQNAGGILAHVNRQARSVALHKVFFMRCTRDPAELTFDTSCILFAQTRKIFIRRCVEK